MNNLTLAAAARRDGGFTYYETLGGGQGACPDADGPSAIHVAMSNTLNTPVEALETEFPLRVRELSLRRGSGGDGEHRGGDGIVRELEALEPMRYTLITERRRHPPRGRDGGGDGAPGRNLLNGEELPVEVRGRPGAGRPPAHRDAGRRRPRPNLKGSDPFRKRRSACGWWFRCRPSARGRRACRCRPGGRGRG